MTQSDRDNKKGTEYNKGVIMTDDLLTVNELAKIAKVSRQTIYSWIKEGLKPETLKPKRFLWKDVKDWMNSRSLK